MSLYKELDNLNLEELKDCFRGPAIDGKEYAASYYDDVTLRIREKGGKAGIDFLLDEIENADEDQLGAILLALTVPKLDQPAIKPLLLKYLYAGQPYIVVRAIDGLWSQGERGATNEVLALRNHPNAWVRGAVLRFMSNIYQEKAVPMLIEALQDPHYIVRENAIDQLDELEAIEALPDVKLFLHDEHEHVRAAAKLAVEHLEEAAQDLAVS